MRFMPPTQSRQTVAVMASLLAFLGACSPAGSPGPAGTGNAAVIIVGPDHSSSVTCVAFQGAEASGMDLLEAAGIPLTLDERNPMGALVCAIDGHGCAYPADDCLCMCEGLGDCAYWASFVRTPSGSWTYAGQGVSSQPLRSGDLYAWVWLPTAANTQALQWLPTGNLKSLCP